MAVRYKSKKTGTVVTFAHPVPRLDKDVRYERVDDKPKPKAKPKAEATE